MKQATATENFDVHIYPIYYHNWRNISNIYIYIYITRQATNEIFSSSNKIHGEVGRAKDLSAPRYIHEAHCSLLNKRIANLKAYSCSAGYEVPHAVWNPKTNQRFHNTPWSTS